MKKLLIITTLALLLCSCESNVQSGKSSDFKYDWKYTYIDDRFDNGTNYEAAEIISSYDEVMAPMQEILGYSDKAYIKKSPDSGLSNFAVDAIREAGEANFGAPVEVALTNFGGIRDDLPKGAVRVYDVYSIFPFDNYLVVSEIKGSNLRKLFNEMASKGYFEALSGVEIIMQNKKITKCNVAGKPLDDSRTYHLATINFLVEGGDGIRVGKYSENIVEYKDLMIRDIVCNKIRAINAEGRTLTLEPDGRVVIK